MDNRGALMSRGFPSDAELVRQTSQLVAAHCRSLPLDATELPGLIASVNRSLRAQNLAQEASVASPKSRSGSKARVSAAKERPRAVAAPQHAPTLSSTNVVYLSDFIRQRIGGAKPKR